MNFEHNFVNRVLTTTFWILLQIIVFSEKLGCNYSTLPHTRTQTHPQGHAYCLDKNVLLLGISQVSKLVKVSLNNFLDTTHNIYSIPCKSVLICQVLKRIFQRKSKMLGISAVFAELLFFYNNLSFQYVVESCGKYRMLRLDINVFESMSSSLLQFIFK